MLQWLRIPHLIWLQEQCASNPAYSDLDNNVDGTTLSEVKWSVEIGQTFRSISNEAGLPNQKNIYGAALALISIMYRIMQGIIAVASLLATMALLEMAGIHSDVCLGFITCTTHTTAV